MLGCQVHYRLPDGQTAFFDSKSIVDDHYNRTIIELTNVDDLTNDPDVTVTENPSSTVVTVTVTGKLPGTLPGALGDWLSFDVVQSASGPVERFVE